MNPKEVVSYIEGQPYISTVPIEPGLTNTSSEKGGQRIVGFNSENGELNEGLVRFDIVFYVSQLISSQKERDFENSSYDDIKRVYSIWVCMNMDENSMNHIHLMSDNVLGSYEWKGKLDLLNIVMIGLAEELPGHDERYELHRLLGALLSKELTIDEKLNIIGNEYDIPIEESFRKDVSVMCNLSQGIEEKGIAIGKAMGEAAAETKIIVTMHNNGFTAEQIASAINKDIEEVEAIIEGKELELA